MVRRCVTKVRSKQELTQKEGKDEEVYVVIIPPSPLPFILIYFNRDNLPETYRGIVYPVMTFFFVRKMIKNKRGPVVPVVCRD